MKLSRGQRIGIALSVIWAVGVYLTITTVQFNRATLEVAITHRLCSDMKGAIADSDKSACANEEENTWNNWTDGTYLEAIAAAILPIPFGWVFADFIIWITGSSRAKKD